MTYGYPLFSGDPYSSQWWGSLAPELNDYLDGPFGGRDVVSVGRSENPSCTTRRAIPPPGCRSAR